MIAIVVSSLWVIEMPQKERNDAWMKVDIGCSGVTGGGAERPGRQHPGGDTLMKVKNFCG